MRSVGKKGEQFLSTARPDYQPPLVLPLTSEMVDGDEHQSATGRVGEFKNFLTLESEGFSEVGNESVIFIHLSSIPPEII